MSKSVLDGIPVVENPLHLKGPAIKETKDKEEEIQVIVGNCVFCGCPIYGQQSVKMGKPIPIRHTCDCHGKNRGKEPLGKDKEDGWDFSKK